MRLGLGNGLSQNGDGDDFDHLVTPNRAPVRGFGPWELTELVRSTLDTLSRCSERGELVLPFTLEEIAPLGSSADGTSAALKGGRNIFSQLRILNSWEKPDLFALVTDLNIDPSQPHAACPDLFGEPSERIGVWSLGIAVIRYATGMSDQDLLRFWRTYEFEGETQKKEYRAPKSPHCDFKSLRKQHREVGPYLPWIKRALSESSPSRFNSISEARSFWDTSVLGHPPEENLPKGERKVVRGWSFTGTKVTKQFKGELSLDHGGRFFCTVREGVVTVYEISPIPPSGRTPFNLIHHMRVGDFGASSIDWRARTVSGISEQGNVWKIDLPTEGDTGSPWVRDHLIRNDDPIRELRKILDDSDFVLLHGSQEEREIRKKKIQEMRETKAWAEQHDPYQISGTVDTEPGKEQVTISAKLRIEGVRYQLPPLRAIVERGARIKPFCTARWCGFVAEDGSTKPTPTSHLFLVNRSSGALHHRRFSFSDFEVNKHYLVGVEPRQDGGRIVVIW